MSLCSKIDQYLNACPKESVSKDKSRTINESNEEVNAYSKKFVDAAKKLGYDLVVTTGAASRDKKTLDVSIMNLDNSHMAELAKVTRGYSFKNQAELGDIFGVRTISIGSLDAVQFDAELKYCKNLQKLVSLLNTIDLEQVPHFDD